MKTLATLLSAVVLCSSLSSCVWLKDKYAKNESATAAFLADNKTAPARANFEGLWYSPEWGIIVLNQETGGKLTGIFRDFYTVRGVVSGTSAYLTLIDDDWTDYTVKLHRKNSEELVGHYSPNVPFSEADSHPLVLKRIQ